VSGEYRPLAAYGAQAGIAVQEARFAPGVSDASLVRAGRLGARFIRPTDGFRSLVYLHDGHAARVLAYWRDEAAIQRYHRTVKVALSEHEAAHWPESPWLTSLEGLRVGAATPYLVTPRMTVDHHDVVVWSPPAAVLIHDLNGIRDPEPLLALWEQSAPESERSPLQDHPGFMFFSACDFGDGEFSAYLGFQTADQLERFVATSYYAAYDDRITQLVAAQNAHTTTAHGRILCGCVKEMG
jgi:hypothetical protein